MFRIQKTFEVAISHFLDLPYESKCQYLHGHNLFITVYCQASDEAVEKNNMMVIDFTHVKNQIHDVIDHQCLNDISGIEGNPTAENIARWICQQIFGCYRVDVQESSGNVATYIDDSFLGGVE